MLRMTVLLAALAAPAHAVGPAQTPLVDPYNSGMLSYQQKEFWGDPKDIRLDDRVIVTAPQSAEDSFHVPVMVDATAIPDVKRIVLSVDYGPIPKILTYYPEAAEPKFAFRFKIDQGTPIRAAVETHSGSWHIGGTVIDAAGGGCAAPAAAYANADWDEHLGEVRGRIWPETGRVRMIVDHPMDTGLADGIPVFIIKNLAISTPDGTRLARIEMHEPVNEDPALSLFFAGNTLGDALRVHGRDNNGNEIDATIRTILTQ